MFNVTFFLAVDFSLLFLFLQILKKVIRHNWMYFISKGWNTDLTDP